MTNLMEVRGDTIQYKITVTRDSEVLNISDATFRFTARKYKTSEALITKDNDAFTIEDGAGGIVVLTIEPEDTEWVEDDIILNFDVEMTESSGRVTTITRGRLQILMNIST